MASYHGVARIHQCASVEYRSSYPSRSLTAEFLRLEIRETFDETLEANLSVVELPIGSLCFVMPSVSEDAGWTAILFYDNGVAVMGWIHPEVWTPFLQEDLPVVTVHHILERGSKEPSLYFDAGLGPRDPGFYERAGKYPGQIDYVMNCIWRGSGRYGSTRDCSGHCVSVVTGFARDRVRMGGVLLFAITPHTSIVYCRHAKHRSVAVGNILSIIAARRIEWKYACRVWCHFCCGEHIMDHPDRLYAALRELPGNTDISRSLIHACLRV